MKPILGIYKNSKELKGILREGVSGGQGEGKRSVEL